MALTFSINLDEKNKFLKKFAPYGHSPYKVYEFCQ